MRNISLILFDASVLGGIQLMTVDTIGILSKKYNVTFITMKISDRILNYLKRYNTNNIKTIPTSRSNGH